MANTRSAIKRIRQNQKRRLRNRHFRGRARTNIKQARQAISTEDMETARTKTMEAVRSLDKAAAKGVVHKNNASRRKSRLMKQLAALEKTQD